jgi:predicted ABC-class ATPase
MLTEELPRIVDDSLYYRAHDAAELAEHVEVVEDQVALREQLDELGLIAFVGEHSVLPRRSRVDDRPLSDPRAVPFEVPQSMRVTVELPNRGELTGMGIPKGVTLIVGGGYHGKSTLLRALERGVYDHVPGDGREWVVTNPRAVKIRAEDGRSIVGVNITPFIVDLPQGEPTRMFSTQEASGSTSQAANIMEALELGAEVLLIDEDTSATNFMIRDARMQRLVHSEHEPITPFIDRVRELYGEYGVSTVVVVGGSGDYFDVADTVIMMKEYVPFEVTEEARAIATQLPTERRSAETGGFASDYSRIPAPRSIDARRRGRVRIRSRGTDILEFGSETIELRAVEQLVDESQTRAVGDMLHYMAHVKDYITGETTLRQALTDLYAELEEHSLDVLSPYDGHPGDYARPRPLEVGAALNRLRTLRVKWPDEMQ